MSDSKRGAQRLDPIHSTGGRGRGGPLLEQKPSNRYQLGVDGEYRSVRRAQQVTKEVSYANPNEMPVLDIAKYLGRRVVRRLKRSFGH